MTNKFKIPDQLRIPPHVQEQMNDFLRLAYEAFAPLFASVARQIKRTVVAKTTTTVGGSFRHICVVGLNRSELLFYNEQQSVFGDSWQELIDESMRRHLALVFFAPRDLDGEPVNPYLFLAGDQLAAQGDDSADAGAYALAEQLIGNLPLLDFCRMSPAEPNTVNIMVAADVLFHWDIKDSYVLPTTPTNWARDVDTVLKGYPRTTRANIYTLWDADLIPKSDRISVYNLRDVPLDNATWINKPTFQEAHGNKLLALGIGVAFSALIGLYYNQQGVEELNEQLRVIEQQIPREGRFADLDRAVREQEKMMQRRELFYLAVKDAARSAQTSQMQLDNFEVRVPDVQEVPKQYLVTFEAVKDAYTGWLQEEPIAKALLTNSVMLEGIRKTPGNTFKLEGLITLDNAWRAYAPYAQSNANKVSQQVAKDTAEAAKRAEDAMTATDRGAAQPEAQTEIQGGEVAQ